MRVRVASARSRPLGRALPAAAPPGAVCISQRPSAGVCAMGNKRGRRIRPHRRAARNGSETPKTPPTDRRARRSPHIQKDARRTYSAHPPPPDGLRRRDATHGDWGAAGGGGWIGGRGAGRVGGGVRGGRRSRLTPIARAPCFCLVRLSIFFFCHMGVQTARDPYRRRSTSRRAGQTPRLSAHP